MTYRDLPNTSVIRSTLSTDGTTVTANVYIGATKKADPIHEMRARKGSVGKAPLIFKFHTGWRWAVRLMLRSL